MKTTTTTIINGRVLGQESLSFNTKSEYENYIIALLAFINDKECEIKSNHEAFLANSMTIDGEHISSFSSDRFNAIIMNNHIAWEEAGLITICSLERE